ncbi:class I SAM-dependent methyltransferase [Streptomyces fradiae]|uniref:class I SAM-dependent methyltransferase n=1 Tax=Streptomyces fradiae TaxID=1906 RepID=UPI0020184B28|nr:class I SAM-dependent methyltransferase [Streptomyces fradiae]UQS30057.1 class I SAM-dependent methyltransferase [Streptomyces fradiae]
MPTLPPDRPHSPSPSASRSRRTAESFGADPERYERSRPRYPGALVEAVLATSPGREVLDVGIGTGIVAGQFRAAGCAVLGVDPDARMAALARRHGHTVEVAPFEEWDPGGRSFDAVVSGQTWHWVDPAAGAAKAAEVLRPGGPLAVFWNDGRPPRGLAGAFADVYARIAPDVPAARLWRAPDEQPYAAVLERAAAGIRASGAFSEPEERRYAWERTYTRDEWLDQLPTTGGHGALSPTTLARLTDAVGRCVDAAGGRFTVSFATLVLTAHLRVPAARR